MQCFVESEHHVFFDDGIPINRALLADALHDFSQSGLRMFPGYLFDVHC